MSFGQSAHRDQMVMFSGSLDECVGDDNPVRFVDAFVGSLDFRALSVPLRRYHPGYR